MKIIALTGPIGSGKTQVANYLRSYGYHRFPFAIYLKRMLKEIGLTDEQLNGHLKETPCELLCGKTPRYAMQTLGTEWRDMIGTELWVRIWENEVKSNGEKIVVDDLRFTHEAQAVHRLGGVIVRVSRPGVKVTHSHHASEANHNGGIECDVVLANDGDLNLLEGRVRNLERGLWT